MFAFLSFVECPVCGKSLPLADVGFPGEPVLKLIDCDACGKRLQVRYDEQTGQMIVEESKVS